MTKAELAKIIESVTLSVLSAISPAETPKETAKVSHKIGGETSAKKAESKDVLDVIVDMREKSSDRLKLPARMFFGKKTCTVDGVEFTSLESDQHRSAPQFPAVFGGNANSVLTFSHIKGRQWTCTVSGKAKKGQKVAEKPVSSGKKISTDSKAKTSPKTAKGQKSYGTRKEQIARFASLAIDNYNDGFVNDFMVENGSKTFKKDARIYLDARQNRQFKAFRLSEGLSVSHAVTLLNKSVFE